MAKKAVIDQITGMMENYTDKEVRKKLSKSEIHQVEITTQETVAGLINTTPNALQKIFGGTDSLYYRIFLLNNEKAIWQSVVRQVFRRLSSGGSFEGVKLIHGIKINKIADLDLKKRNVRLMAGSTKDRWHIQVEANSYSFTIYEFCRGLRKALWEEWCDRVKQKGLASGIATGTKEAHQAIGAGTNYSHDEEYTIGVDRFKILLEDIRSMEGFGVAFKFKETTINLEDWLQDGVNISVELDPILQDGYIVGEKRVIKGRLEQQTKKLDTDWNQLKPKILDSLSNYLNKEKKPKFVDEQHALDFEASDSLKKDIEKEKVRKEVESIEKSFKTKGAKGTKVKKKIAKKSTRKPRVINKTFKKKVVTTKMRTVVIPEGVRALKNMKEEKGTERPITLNALKSKINRSLPAEIRRNMGRPALINRTGQFSNSARVLNLRDTGKTITGEYTYTLTGGGQSKNKKGVYSTFENLGTKQWPTGYNPKPLIAKSIKNLAARHVDRKFTLRRV